MKKIAAILTCLLVFVSCAALTGCGKQDLTNSKYLGTWVATRAISLGEEVNVNEAVKGGMRIELKPDGTAIGYKAVEPISCKWKETAKGVKFKGDFKASAKAEGDQLVMKFSGLTLYLEKQSETASAVNSIGDAIGAALGEVLGDAAGDLASIFEKATSGQ